MNRAAQDGAKWSTQRTWYGSPERARIVAAAEERLRQGAQLAKLQKCFTPFEALKMATCDNAELLKLSDKLNPYPEGTLGVIEEGAYADLILVAGNPLEKLDLVADPVENFDLIVKYGVIYKNTLE